MKLYKLQFSTFLISISALTIIFYTRDPIAVNTWDFGFLIHAFPEDMTLVSQYVFNMHRRSFLYIIWTKIFQSFFGKYIWITYPIGLVLFVLVYAYLRELSRGPRLVVTFVAVSMPYSVLPMVMSSRRDIFDLILIVSIFVFLKIISRLDDGHSIFASPHLAAPAIGFVALIIWGLHYTVWPFFAAFGSLYIILHSNRGLNSISIVLVMLVGSFLIYEPPAEVYFLSISAITSSAANGLFDQIFNAYAGRGIPEGIVMTVPPAKAGPNSWLRTANYIGHVVFPLFIGISLLRAAVDWINTKKHQRAVENVELYIFIAACGAFLSTLVLLLLRGFFARALFFWPLMMASFGAVVFLVISCESIPTWPISKQTAVTALVLLAVLQLLVVAHGPIKDTTSQQIEAGEFASDTNEQKPIYSALDHANLAILESDRGNIRTARVYYFWNNSIGLKENAAKVYSPSRVSDGYVFRSECEGSVTTWKGQIPMPDHTPEVSQIYTNGCEIWQVN